MTTMRITAAGTLTTLDHDRDRAGMTYVYPVVSRRAGGVSLGVNLNPNNACNWACSYCQVPGLTRGGPPRIDLARLEAELRAMLDDIVRGDFMTRQVAEGMRRFHDIALSGNGEPTSAREFPLAVDLIGRAMRDFDLLGKIKLVLISNGSLMDRAYVRDGLRAMAALGGEVWFKIDSATREGMARINQVELDPEGVLRRLQTCAALCPTWIQTCVFATDGAPPAAEEQAAYLALLARCRAAGTPPGGVLLYSLARAVMQPGAEHLSAVPAAWMETYAARIRALGYEVRVAP
jgi:wyosine [tRNA(Phe)-imidazoG37] synthetase (radical SAM superfamily)